jgi:hypothetical protein
VHYNTPDDAELTKLIQKEFATLIAIRQDLSTYRSSRTSQAYSAIASLKKTLQPLLLSWTQTRTA